MSIALRAIVVALTVAIALGVSTAPGYACATCFGAEDSPQTEAMNAAIFTMLGVTYLLFLGMGAIGFMLWRNSRANANELAMADIEIEEDTNDHG